LDGRLGLDALALDARQPEVGAHEVLFATGEGFDGPDYARLGKKQNKILLTSEIMNTSSQSVH
jgi:hypothetical protein